MKVSKEKLVKITKKVLDVIAAGEMFQEDIEKGGEWYEAAKELADVAKGTGKFVKVKPFDQYQGPFALLDNGSKIFLTENEGEYFLQEGEYLKGNQKGYTLDKKQIKDFYKSNAEKFIENITTKKPKVKKAKKDTEKEEAKGLLKDLEKISSKVIQAGNELRDLSATRGKDMSQWRRQKGVSSEKVKKWVDELHKQGFINAALDKASNELMKIEKEIKKFLGEE